MERLQERVVQEEPRQRLLQGEDSPFIPTYAQGDYLNPQELKSEEDVLIRALEAEKAKLGSVHLTLKTPQEKQDFKGWQSSRDEFQKVVTFLTTRSKGLDLQVETEKPVTLGQVVIRSALYAGGELLIARLLRHQLGFAQKLGFLETIKPLVELQSFLFCGGHQIHVAGISINEIMSKDLRPPLPSWAVFRFLTEVMLMRHYCSHERVLEQNQEPPLNFYPNKTKQMIENLGAEVQAMINLTPKTIKTLLAQGSQGVEKEVIKHAKNLYERIETACQDVYHTLLNPESLEFSQVRDLFENYLRKGRFERTLVIYLLDNQEDFRIYQLYRATRKMKKASPYLEFYELLEESIRAYIGELPSSEEILTIDDSVTILESNGERSEKNKPPTFETLRETVSAIFARSSTREYTLDPKQVQWGQLVEPQTVAIKFDQNRPREFALTLGYENEVGESLNLVLNFDTAGNTFDWNFLEAPEEEGLQGVYAAVVVATQQVMLSLLKQVEADYHERQNIKERKAQPPSLLRPPRERVTDEIYEIRKQVRAGQPRTGRLSFLDFSPPRPENEQVPKRILLPEENILEKILENIGFPDRQLVRRGIEEFNKAGRGEFTRKRGRSRDGDILYALRVNCLAPKGVRVLLREASPLTGTRNFEILDIRYRKDSYRRMGG